MCIFFFFVAPVKESPTIYDAFMDKNEKPETNGYGNHEAAKGDAAASTKKSSHSKKGKGQEKKEKPLTLEDAVNKVKFPYENNYIKCIKI